MVYLIILFFGQNGISSFQMLEYLKVKNIWKEILLNIITPFAFLYRKQKAWFYLLLLSLYDHERITILQQCPQ